MSFADLTCLAETGGQMGSMEINLGNVEKLTLFFKWGLICDLLGRTRFVASSFKGINRKSDDILRWVSLSDFAERFRNRSAKFRNRSAQSLSETQRKMSSRFLLIPLGDGVFGLLWTCSETFGYYLVHLDAFSNSWRVLEHINFCSCFLDSWSFFWALMVFW